MANPIKFLVRLVYQSIKLLLRIVFILLGGLLPSGGGMSRVADFEEENNSYEDKYDSFGYSKSSLLNKYTGELRDW